MRLLFDQNLSFRLSRVLADVWPDSTQVRLAGLKASDHAIWRLAAEQGYAIVSLDADFAEMAALFGPPPKILWPRCGNQSTRMIETLLRRASAPITVFEADMTSACLEIY